MQTTKPAPRTLRRIIWYTTLLSTVLLATQGLIFVPIGIVLGVTVLFCLHGLGDF